MPALLTQADSLTEQEKRALIEFEAGLHRVLPSPVRSLILFGSKARGDAHPESDIDLLLVVPERTKYVRKAISEVTAEVWDHTGVLLAPIVFPQDEADRLSALGTPFMVNVARDGIVLEGEVLAVAETNKREVSRNFLGSARERLESAKLLLDHGLYRDSISRSYYAFLDAADAALVVRGFIPKSHSAAINLFGQHIVQAGLLDKVYGSWINDARDARMDADYERDMTFSFEDAKDWLDKATEFVNVIQSAVGNWLAEEEGER